MSASSKAIGTDILRDQLLAQQPQSKGLLDRLMARPRGRGLHGAFAPIKDGRCAACNMAVAAVRLQRAKDGQFINCDSCSRFLYHESK